MIYAVNVYTLLPLLPYSQLWFDPKMINNSIWGFLSFFFFHCCGRDKYFCYISSESILLIC